MARQIQTVSNVSTDNTEQLRARFKKRNDIINDILMHSWHGNSPNVSMDEWCKITANVEKEADYHGNGYTKRNYYERMVR